MATVNGFVPGYEATDHSDDRSVWTVSFSDSQRREMLADDLLAGKTVSAILVSILALGLAAMICVVVVPSFF